ncbi:LacI family transcriptional regulator [Mucilaginibacter sp. UR6-1]|uniref:LacI family DNA-binding transcriptional regulator n=1 Tax=Mucilaginibacter sp. UR6-1 TaxID=1435643 RepID=UPI001E41310F|nr:LacI family DNA-binding transcriptional regulator [Mucilaginibacter sp. UR6-1]MCC8410883.1 LacI family transcriptional regulator [Mucilaginibacter sp. UR6-1]
MADNKKKISIKDIAKLTNTSITTVSFVINGKGRISSEIKKKVLDVAMKNGYEPNRMAVGLRTGVSKVIGLIVETIGGPFFGAMAKVIEEEAEKAGYGVIYCSTNNNVQTGKNVIKMLSNQLVDGYIVTPMKGLENDIEAIMNNGKPVVLIDGYFPELKIPHVLVDNYNSVFNAIRSMITDGYKNIAYVTPDLDLVQLEERKSGYYDAIKAGGLKEDGKNLLKVPFGCEKTEAIGFIKDFLKKNKKIDAVFFSTNYLGSMGLQAINELKLNIPDDIAMVSFDDNELFELYPPGITAVKQPTYQIAKSAIDLLLSRLNDDKLDISEIRMQIPADLIRRGSTKILK